MESTDGEKENTKAIQTHLTCMKKQLGVQTNHNISTVQFPYYIIFFPFTLKTFMISVKDTDSIRSLEHPMAYYPHQDAQEK